MHIGIASMMQFQCVPTTYLTENKETYFEIYTYQELYPLALHLKHLNLPISILKNMSLYSKLFISTRQLFFMNYAFAKLILARL